MATDRKFCRFNKQAETRSFGMPEIPEGGLCLSAFLVISQDDNANSALMGHLNPTAPWDHIGALDSSRVEAHSKGWMLPSSHLLVYESPQEAAKRILREQLEMNLTLGEPKVVSETYTPKRFPNLPRHWDIEFIFKGKMSKDLIKGLKTRAWLNLAFVNLDYVRKSEIARSHEAILEAAGLTFKQP